jgi:hypothetical protein
MDIDFAQKQSHYSHAQHLWQIRKQTHIAQTFLTYLNHVTLSLQPSSDLLRLLAEDANSMDATTACSFIT